jgi:transposase
MWVATQDLPRSAGHPFYARLNHILDQNAFGGFVEGLCEHVLCGRRRTEFGARPLPPLAADRLFRRLGRRAHHCVAGGRFICAARVSWAGVARGAADHSTISRTHRLIDLETHGAAFTWMLQRLADAGLVKGKTVGIDATTLEANEALRSIVRRETHIAGREIVFTMGCQPRQTDPIIVVA